MSLQDDIKGLDPSKLSDDDKIGLIKGLQAAGQKWLPDKDYFEQFERGIKMVSEKDETELLMQFWLYGRNYDAKDTKDEWAIMPIGIADWPPEGHTKQETMEALGVMYASQYPKHMLVNIVHTSEAWMARREKAEDIDKGPMPSKDPNRIEVVIVTAVSMDRRLSQYAAEILRDKKGKFAGLKDTPEMNLRHDPEKPHDPRNMRDYLSEYIYGGYGKIRDLDRKGKEEKPNGKT